MAPPKKSKLPNPLPDGFILTDTDKKQWRLGKIIGQGGFGLIYLAAMDVSRPVAPDTEFVIKVEYHENGPLFSELKFYQRAAKPESMQKWKRSRKLDFLGIPTYWGSGLAEYKDLRYRFMAMDRLGSDLQRVCDRNGGRLKKATVLKLGQILVDVLEYIHENEYVHADIKAANLLLSYSDSDKVYLADYGLSYRYSPDGVHKEYKENPKKGHNGTIEYTSLDAHKGVAPSRRGDLQILGFCLLHLLCGSLPWDGLLKDPSKVEELKARLMSDLPDSVQHLAVSGASTDELAEFFCYVRTLDYQDKPDYHHLKDILASTVSGSLDFSMPQVPGGKSTNKDTRPQNQEKKAGRARGSSKAKPVVKGADEGVHEGTKSGQVPAGPTKPQSQHQANRISGAVRRSQRTTAVQDYREDDSETDEENDNDDEEEEEEEEARPRPIPACYLRGPPIGPRAKSKQKNISSQTLWKTDEHPVTPKRWIRPERRTPKVTDCEIKSQTPTAYREGWENRPPHHRLDYSQYPGSDPKAQEAGPTQRNGLLKSLIFGGAFFFLGALSFQLFYLQN